MTRRLSARRRAKKKKKNSPLAGRDGAANAWADGAWTSISSSRARPSATADLWKVEEGGGA